MFEALLGRWQGWVSELGEWRNREERSKGGGREVPSPGRGEQCVLSFNQGGAAGGSDWNMTPSDLWAGTERPKRR